MKRFGWIVLPVLIIGFLVGKYFYAKPKYVNGEAAHNFSAKLLNGSDFALENLKGNYVLLDFWGSWCGPCRQENPGIVRVYNEFHGKDFKAADDFEIVSVAIETDENRWKAAIQKDGLVWPYHISEMQRFKSPIVQGYGVREIPTKYFLNPKLQIIAVNPTVDELQKLLQERLKS